MSLPNPQYWGLDEPKKFSKARTKLPKEIQAIFIQKIDEKIHSKNPVDYGSDKWERTKYGLVWMARLNDYYRFSYQLDPKHRTIRLVRIGSHKDVGTEK